MRIPLAVVAHVAPKTRSKGRNPELVCLRNEKLVRRFYYWFEVKRLRIDDVLLKLSREEFFIEETTIMELLKENQSLLDAMYRKN
jgi:hypothetical protein